MKNLTSMRGRLLHTCAYAALGSVALPTCVHAQTTAAPPAPVSAAQTGSTDDVIVTARRKSEREIDVPVAISAVTSQQLDQKGLTDLSAIGTQVPDLKVQTNVVSFGGTIALRGISSASSTSSIEQAVSVNVDGVPVSYSGIVLLGQFDLGQVEVLKGPQALFFGKNSTAGIIALKSAEPTRELDVLFRAGYETEARDYSGEAHISGPLSDNVQARLAVRYSSMDGWIRNYIPAGSPGVFGPANSRSPGTDALTAKAALNFEPTSALTFKLKAAYSKTDTQGLSLSQRFFCPTGVPQGPSVYPGETDCKLDNENASGDLNPALHAIDPRFPANGVPYTTVKQYLGVVEADYTLGRNLSLQSITGFYDLSLRAVDNATNGPIAIISFADQTKKRTYSEELRLTTNDLGPLSLMGGVFLQRDTFADGNRVVIGRNAIPDIGFFRIRGTTISPFVQGAYDLTSRLNLSAGVRYTHEVKRQTTDRFSSQIVPRISFNDTSPEVTLAYKPIRDVNIYASYKQGYKSGGFQTEFVSIPSALAAGAKVNNSFDAEKVRGFEGGVKARLLDSRLRVAAAVYRFKYSNLQLGRFDPVLVTTIIDNIGAATTKGAELDLEYQTPVSGLSFSGAAAYNIARYDRYNSACYNGQSAAAGCSPATRTQNLAGRPLPRAPKFSGSIGGIYQGSISENLGFRLNAGLTYSSSYETLANLVPGSTQPHYTTYDFGLAVGPKDGRWEAAFIGKNLGNVLYASSGAEVPITGSATRLADVFTTVSRGRELLFRLTFRPFAR